MKTGTTAVVSLGLLAMFVGIQVCCWLLGLWVTGSIITSGLKVVSDDCGKEYRVETVIPFAGSMFCPTTK